MPTKMSGSASVCNLFSLGLGAGEDGGGGGYKIFKSEWFTIHAAGLVAFPPLLGW